MVLAQRTVSSAGFGSRLNQISCIGDDRSIGSDTIRTDASTVKLSNLAGTKVGRKEEFLFLCDTLFRCWFQIPVFWMLPLRLSLPPFFFIWIKRSFILASFCHFLSYLRVFSFSNLSTMTDQNPRDCDPHRKCKVDDLVFRRAASYVLRFHHGSPSQLPSISLIPL